MSGMSKQDADIIGKALQQPASLAKRLPALPARGGIPSSTAKGNAAQPAIAATGSGIDSPLTESSRTNYGTTYVTTSDGLFSIAFTAVKQLTMKDAANRTVIFNYQEPTA